MPASLRFRHIETFHAAMLAGSLTRAATALRTSQPTVSRVLAELSAILGFPLFRRQGRMVVPTREAVALLEEVEGSFRGLETIRQAADRIRGAAGERVRVAAVTSVALSLLPGAVARFRERFPEVPVSIESGSYDSIRGRVTAQQCEVGFALVPPGQAGIEVHPVAAVEAVWVRPGDHPLAARRTIAPEDLADAAFVSVGLQLPSRRQIDDLFAARGIRRRLVLEVQSGAIACAMVARGLGVAVLDALTVSASHDPRIAVRPFRPAVTFHYSAMTAERARSSRLVATLIGCVAEAVREVARTSPSVKPGGPPMHRRRRHPK